MERLRRKEGERSGRKRGEMQHKGRGEGGERERGERRFIAQQCGRQKEGEVESERDYCLLESSNLELCHEYQRLHSPTVNASLSLLPH